MQPGRPHKAEVPEEPKIPPRHTNSLAQTEGPNNLSDLALSFDKDRCTFLSYSPNCPHPSSFAWNPPFSSSVLARSPNWSKLQPNFLLLSSSSRSLRTGILFNCPLIVSLVGLILGLLESILYNSDRFCRRRDFGIAGMETTTTSLMSDSLLLKWCLRYLMF